MNTEHLFKERVRLALIIIKKINYMCYRVYRISR